MPSIEKPLPEEDNFIGEKTEIDSHKISSVQNKKVNVNSHTRIVSSKLEVV
jgi:hypothetical protein